MSDESEFSESFSSTHLDMETIEMQLHADAKKEKRDIMTNITFISLGFMLHFTAVRGLYTLQSTLNFKNKLGTITLCLHCTAMALSNLLLSTIVVRRFGYKNTIIASFVTYLPFCFSQFDATPFTIIPSAIFCGLGTGPLWVALSFYLIVMSRALAQLLVRNINNVTWCIFGVFFMIYEGSGIIGNAISSIGFIHEITNYTLLENLTVLCGADFCPTHDVEKLISLRQPIKKNVNLLITLYIGFIIAASLIVCFFVDSLVRYKYSIPEIVDVREMTLSEEFISTTKTMFKRKQLFIIPITLFHGCQYIFFITDYTEAYVACSWGIHNTGYVMIAYGALKAISSFLTGWLVRFKGKIPIFACATGLHAILLITLFRWKSVNYIPSLFFMSGLWGICNGAWVVSINALYGIMFPLNLEAAYSNCRLWEAVGYVIGYAYSSWICIKIKVGILIGILIIGMAGFLDIDIRFRKTKKLHLPAQNVSDIK